MVYTFLHLALALRGTTLHITYMREENQNMSSFYEWIKMITKLKKKKKRKRVRRRDRQRQET